MKKNLLALLFLIGSSLIYAQSSKIFVKKDSRGHVLEVNGKPFMVNGMNWDYFPIGTNYSYSLWNQSDDFIKAALDQEMGLLQNMGVNTIRMYTGVQPKWIQYIYENSQSCVREDSKLINNILDRRLVSQQTKLRFHE